jgi:hypothetical protein
MTTTKRARALAAMIARDNGPQLPGGTYLCGYWGQEYTVLAMATTIDGGTCLYHVRWADGREGRHCTPWDARADRVVCQPAS